MTVATTTSCICLALVICLSHSHYISQKHHVKSRYYPRYHLAPPHGWMNDPNGFSIFLGDYHLFYQYNPKTSEEPGIAHWGHAKSSDLVTWEHLPIAMYPDEWYDRSGVFSGSAFVEDDILYIYYTGNVNHPYKAPDHEQHQALAISTDGINVKKYKHNPVIYGEDLQPNIRDPKVWKHEDCYYMVLGHSINSDCGKYGIIYLYESTDKINWKKVSVLAKSDGTLGYMFECPDFFELDGKFVLLFSPQGIEPEGDNYRNLYQTGYIVGDFDYHTKKFKHITKFRELDHGHDFYATQTLDDNGRRVLVAWMDMWEQNYPERDDGFTGMMTLPRVLSLTHDCRLLQNPIPEISQATEELLGNGHSHSTIVLKDKAGVITLCADLHTAIEVTIGSTINSSEVLTISYSPCDRKVSLDRGGEDGVRRAKWEPHGQSIEWKIFVDASSIELFCGEGEVTFSSRFFFDAPLSVCANTRALNSFEVKSLCRTVPVPSW